MVTNEQLISEIEKTAKHLGLSPATISSRIGQGGHFYKRRKEGYEMMPSTAERALKAIIAMRGDDNSDVRHGVDKT